VKNWQQQKAAQQQVANQPNAQANAAPVGAQLAAVTDQQSQPKADPPIGPWLTVNGDRIDLVKPEILLMGFVFVGPKQVNRITPERAYIVGGILVVEELGLWFPVATIQLGKKTSP
jgi:hypothetical protein